MPGNGLLYGYYQSEKYFDSIRDRLRDELTPRSDLAGTNRTWKDRIDGTNSVAVHVRRGDYTARGWALPPKYYRAAIRQLDCRHSTAELFFFSDDMAWVRRNVDSLLPNCRSSSAVHFVDCNSGEEVVNDLVLMQSCRHNVIANSTLSWWGAWLNRHDEKTVLTPMCWIHNSVGDTDIIPERWTPVRW